MSEPKPAMVCAAHWAALIDCARTDNHDGDHMTSLEIRLDQALAQVQERDEAIVEIKRELRSVRGDREGLIECLRMAERQRDAARAEIADLLPRMDADALMMTQVGRELDAAIRERDESRSREQWFVERAASGANGGPSLDCYRELGQRAAQAENARDALAERVRVLTEALQKIAAGQNVTPSASREGLARRLGMILARARAALAAAQPDGVRDV